MLRAGPAVGALRAFEPLAPGGDEARRRLELELARPEYDQLSPLERVLRWLESILPSPGDHALGATTGALVVALVLLVLAALVVWRLRDVRQVSDRRRRRERGLAEPGRTAQGYRDEARSQLDAGACDRAVVAAFRALVVTLDDREVVLDAPGRTAHEVAEAARRAAAVPGPDATWAAACFDSACYGHPDGPLPGPGEPQRTTPADVERLLAVEAAAAGAPR